jgi:hypothetical protein
LDPRSVGARDLILAVFRLAVADYLGIAFNHDSAGPVRRTRHASYVGPAGLFLAGAWSCYLADLVGLEGLAISREARKLADEGAPARMRREPMAA